MLHVSSFSAVLRSSNYVLIFSFFLLLCGEQSNGCFRRQPARITPTPQNRWMPWTDWSSCSTSCGAGRITRHRFCRRGKVCYSPKETEIKACVNYHCSDSNNQWTAWSACSASCGLGWMRRSQTCPEEPCREFFEQKKRCNAGACPIDGGLTQWGPWSACSVTCGVGTETRFRSCSNPPPQFGGADCRQPNVSKRTCSLVECHPKVHGNWSSWTSWSSCSRSCGEGVKRRLRRCDQPAPAFGGNPCTGVAEETQPCVAALYCEPPVDGQWSSWGEWTQCSKHCRSGGTRTRLRHCNQPSPKFGGKQCVGKAFEVKTCDNLCVVDGGWGAWMPVTECRSDSNCAKGLQHMERKCDNPEPKLGGKKCQGDRIKTVPCWSSLGCPGGLQPPADFSTQSFENKTVLVSWRQAPFGSVPASFKISFKLLSAADTSAETVMVDAKASMVNRPVDGWRFSRRISLSHLSGSVVLWVESVSRSDPPKTALSNKHTFMVGEVDGSWSAWDPWSKCPVTCGSGVQTRIRRCDSPTRTPNGRPCPGKSRERLVCDRGFCP